LVIFELEKNVPNDIFKLQKRRDRTASPTDFCAVSEELLLALSKERNKTANIA